MKLSVQGKLRSRGKEFSEIILPSYKLKVNLTMWLATCYLRVQCERKTGLNSDNACTARWHGTGHALVYCMRPFARTPDGSLKIQPIEPLSWMENL